MPLPHSRDLGAVAIGAAAPPVRQTRHGAKRHHNATQTSVACENTTDQPNHIRPAKQLKSHHEPTNVIKQSTTTTTTNVRQTRNALSNISNANHHHQLQQQQFNKRTQQQDAVAKAHKEKEQHDEKVCRI
jgi:FtsZ-interacting cell division protein ZipA